MKKEFMTSLAQITTRIKTLREDLPHICDQNLLDLNTELAQLDLSQADAAEVAKLQDAFAQLSDEVAQTMKRLDQFCDELRNNVDEMHTHSEGVKTYATAQMASKG